MKGQPSRTSGPMPLFNFLQAESAPVALSVSKKVATYLPADIAPRQRPGKSKLPVSKVRPKVPAYVWDALKPRKGDTCGS
mgnify:FL=1